MEKPGKKLGRPSRIYESIHEARCPHCGDWTLVGLFRAHLDGRHPKSERPTEYEIREVPVVERIVEYVMAGNYLEPSAAACGIPVRTMYEWLSVAEEWEGVPEEEIPEDRRIFSHFSLALKVAREAAQSKYLRMIERAAPADWKAAAWILERTAPARYSRIERLRVGGDETAGPIRVDRVEPDPDFIGEVERIYRDAGILPDVGSVDNSNGHGPGTNGKRPK